MNGWLRIWVVVSVLWTLGVLIYLLPRLPDRVVEEGPWLKYNVNPSGKFISSSSGQFPVHTIHIDLDDGTSVPIVNIPILPENEIKHIERKLKDLAKERGTSVSESSIQNFVGQVLEKNEELKKLNTEYLLLLKELNEAQTSEWWNSILTIIAYIAGGPLSLLLAGYTVSWVREGFTSHLSRNENDTYK